MTQTTTSMEATPQTTAASRFAAHWKAKRFIGRSSYTLVGLPNTVQDYLIPMFRRAAIAKLRALTEGRRLGKVVDMACGAGDWSLDYLDFADEVVGFDVNAEFVAAAQASARHLPPGKVARFVESDMMAFDDYEGADMISMAACAMLLSDDELDVVLERITKALPIGGLFYVRCTTVNPLQEPWQNWFGCYRTREFYEQKFRSLGYEIADFAFSQELLSSHILSRVGVESEEKKRELWHWLRTVNIARKKPEYCNWYMRRVR